MIRKIMVKLTYGLLQVKSHGGFVCCDLRSDLQS